MQKLGLTEARNSNIIGYKALASICLLSSIIIAILPIITGGLGALWVVPFFTFLLFLYFNEVISKTKNYLGVFVVYLFIVVRNAISPLLMAISGSTVTGLLCTTISFRMAIISNMFETLFVFIALKYLYRDKVNADNKTNIVAEKDYKVDISIIGLIVFFSLLILIVYRGHINNVLSYISVFGTQHYGIEPLYTYDFACILAMKSIICLVAIGIIYHEYIKRRKVTTKNLLFSVCLLFGFINVAFYDGTARAHFLVTAIATIVVLSYLFPNKKKVLYSSILGVSLLIVSVIFLTDTLHFLDSNRSIVSGSNSLSQLSNTIETYCNGISNVAFGFSSYNIARGRISIDTYLSNFFSQFGFGSFPGIRLLTDHFTSTPTFTDIYRGLCSTYNYRGQGYILPPMIEALYIGGYFLMLPLNFLYYYLVLRFQRFLINKRNDIANISYIYVLAYMELLAGFCLGYDGWIEVHAMTNNIFYMLIIVFFNTIGTKIRLKVHN